MLRIGVAIQLAFFGLFTFLAIRFNFIARRFDAEFEARLTQADEKCATIDGSERKLIRNWPALLRVTNVACGLILVSFSDPRNDEVIANVGSFCLDSFHIPNG
jgi:hypothetical protein